jgi:hypothetical protein
LQTIPLQFTSLAAPDPYLEVGGGASWHRVKDLLQLRQLIEASRQKESSEL